VPRKKHSVLPVNHADEVPRDQGVFEPVSTEEAQEISLARVSEPAQVAARLDVAECFCREAETWAVKSEGVAKSCLRDALVCLAEVWLGLPVVESIAFIRSQIDRQKLANKSRKS
jgi:hypothetical protein